jgi:hypothetical protein
MSRKVVHTTLTALLLSSLMMVLVSTTASAGAGARSGPVRYALAATTLGPPSAPDKCQDTQVRLAGDPAAANGLCTSGPNSGNFAYARAHADKQNAWTRTQTTGWAHAGDRLGTASTVPSTADSFDLSHGDNGANQTTVTLRGTLFLDPSSTDQKQAAQNLFLTVYPNEAAAEAGTGWLARGELRTWGNKDLCEAHASGLLADGDFTITHGAGNTLTVTTNPPTGFTKLVSHPAGDSAGVVVELTMESASLTVPGLSPVGLILLTLLLAAAGFYVLQTRRRAAAA